MRAPIILGAGVLAALALAAAPVQSQTTADKVEQQAGEAGQKTKDVTKGATTAMSDSWLTPKTKIALFADERVKGNGDGSAGCRRRGPAGDDVRRLRTQRSR